MRPSQLVIPHREKRLYCLYGDFVKSGTQNATSSVTQCVTISMSGPCTHDVLLVHERMMRLPLHHLLSSWEVINMYMYM